MAVAVLDSSVLIALLNTSDSHHVACKSFVENSDKSFKISVITLIEVLIAPMREGAAMTRRITSALERRFPDRVAVDEEIATAAAKIRAHSNLVMPDSIISATALVHSATLVTCDATLAKNHPGAQLIS